MLRALGARDRRAIDPKRSRSRGLCSFGDRRYNGEVITEAATEQRCPQCLEVRAWPSTFLGVRGKPVRWCTECRAHYKGWGTKTEEEKRVARNARRKDFADAGAFRVRWVARTLNEKTGPIPLTLTERGSCPPACSLKGAGCYAEEHMFLRYHWERTVELGLFWDEFLEKVEALPEGTLWRHNEAGDLPGKGNAIARPALRALALANAGRRGFTFTHKPLTPENAAAIREAVALGFAINLSADSIEQADALVAANVAPVSVVLPTTWPSRAVRSPAGNQIVVCPAQTSNGVTCKTCRLCAAPDRKAIVGFRAHGLRQAMVTELVRTRRGDDLVAHLPKHVPPPRGRPPRLRPPPSFEPRPGDGPLSAVLRAVRPDPRAPSPVRHVSEALAGDARRERERRAANAVADARLRIAALLERGRAAVAG